MGIRRRFTRIGIAGLAAGLVVTLVPQVSAHAAVANVAGSAVVSVSSQNVSTGQTGVKAVDGVAQGYPTDYTREWATVGGKTGSWITLTWAQPMYVTQVKLYDRPNTDDQVTAGTLTFTDGQSTSTLQTGALTNTGTATSLSFDERRVTSVTLRVDGVSSTTYNVGLAEIEVFGTPTQAVNQIPTANAGNAFTAVTGKQVSLDGTKSSDPDGSIASYTWSLVSQPAGSNISLTNPNTSTPVFTPTVTGAYTFSLVVTDNSGATSTNTAQVTVTVTAPPPNQAPIADAGVDQTATVNTLVTLDGSKSKDLDGTIASYAWTVVSPAGVTLSSTTTAKPTFTPTATGDYTFSLIVTDNQGLASTADQVKVTVSNTAPVLQNLAPKSVTVTASSQNTAASQTAAKAIDGAAIGYPSDYTKEWATAGGKAGSWIQLDWSTPVSVNKIVLYDRPNADDQVTAGTLTFSDGTSVKVGALTNTSPTAGTAAGTTVTFDPKNITWVRFTVDTVSTSTYNVGLAEIEVWGYPGNGNWPPTANAGPDQSVASAAPVTLDGTGSKDPEGTTLTYAWTQTTGPAVTLSSATTAKPTFTAPTLTNTTPIVLTFELKVTDASGQTAVDTITVTINPPAVLTAADNGMAGVFTINYDNTFTGQTATLQVQTIATTMTTENPTATWKNIGTATLNTNGDATITITDPYEVTHNYRAITTTGATTNTITYAAPKTSKNTGLPTLYLNTNESVGITDRSTDHEGTVELVPGANVPECVAVAPGKVKTSGRGNSTWSLPKKPYKFNFDTSTAMCGIAAGKKWALIANYEDISLMRNMAAYWMGQQLSGLAWTPHYAPVDLYLNGSYQGQYLLIERITINKSRVNIDELKTTSATTTPTITGGYLMEWNHGQADDGGMVNPDIYAGNSGGLYVKEPDAEKGELTAPQKSYIQNHMNTVDAVLFGSNFTDPVNGWRKYIDQNSAIDYWIVMEMTKNYGANFRSSVWMYKARDATDGNTGKLFFGPIWDFDTGQGNADYGAGQASTSGWWMRDPNAAPRQSDVTWMNRLFSDPQFKAAAVARWKAVSPTIGGLDSYLGTMQGKISTSASLDHSQWGLGSFSTDAASMRSWLKARKSWIDANISN